MPPRKVTFTESESLERPYGELLFITPRFGDFQKLRVSIITVEPHGTTSKHSHPQEEVWYIVFGEGVVVGNDSQFAVRGGEFVLIPADDVHQLMNRSQRLPLIFLAIMSPPRESGDTTYHE